MIILEFNSFKETLNENYIDALISGIKRTYNLFKSGYKLYMRIFNNSKTNKYNKDKYKSNIKKLTSERDKLYKMRSKILKQRREILNNTRVELTNNTKIELDNIYKDLKNMKF